MDQSEREQRLHELVTTLSHQKLDGAARLLLDIVGPVSFLASQVALVVRPLTPRGRWHDYVDALTEEEGWNAFRRFINRPES